MPTSSAQRMVDDKAGSVDVRLVKHTVLELLTLIFLCLPSH
jgi:hypothetical protein